MATATENRVFDAARKDQGFRDQPHLDRFFRYRDHVRGCQNCGKPAPGIWIDDSYQPGESRCKIALDLGKRIDRD